MKDYRKEEEILKDYTAETDIDKIYEKEWNTAEVVELMRKAIENCTIHGVVKSLKEKKKPTFKEWLEMYNYKKVKTVFVAHGKEYYYTEVYNDYKEWCNLHF